MSRAGRTWWLIVAVVIGVVVALIAFPLMDKATAVPTVNLTSGQVMGKQISDAFENGELGNSEDRLVPRKVRRKLNAYAENNGLSDSERWWKGAVEKTICMANNPMLGPDFCLKHGSRPNVVALNLELTKVKVVCGGAGAIAAWKGGVAGFAAGAASCAWTRYANRWADTVN